MPRNGGYKRLEKPTQTAVLNLLESRGAWCQNIVAASKRGCPDVIGCYKGLFLAFETKSLSGKPTPLQEYNIEKIHEAEGIAHVVRSAEEVEVLLEEIDDKNNQV